MYVPDGPLRGLEMMVFGYYNALGTHGLVERVPEMTSHFSSWLYVQTGWSTSAGWAYAITSTSGKRPPLDVFFELVDRYRKLRPVAFRSARLSRRNAPTGKRVTEGLNGRFRRPTGVEIVRYSPTRLHFLRFAYGDRRENDSILWGHKDSCETSLRFAKQWMADALQIREQDWRA